MRSTKNMFCSALLLISILFATGKGNAKEPFQTRQFKEVTLSTSNSTANDRKIHSLILQAARRHKIDPLLITAIIYQESRFRQFAVSPVGAQGLMQLMPRTAMSYGVHDSFDPGQNIACGTAYLRDLIDEFGKVELALAAYNAGEGAVRRYKNTVPPFPETLNYVASVLRQYRVMQEYVAAR
jgi:soluble lytic murein transglycosylase-like protein